MRHINTKIATLLHEGFSISTLESLNETQINLLYEKAKKVKKEPKEEVTKTIKQYNLGNKEDKDKFLDASKAVTDKNKVNFDPKNDTASIGETELQEKSKSKQQQKIMGLALSVKRGDTPKSKVSKSVKDMSNKMSEKDLEDFASTKHKGLPKKIETTESIKKGVKRNDQKDMIDGVIEIIKKVKDINNRKSIAKDMVNKFKRENIQTDFNKFMEDCGVDDTKKPVKNIGTNKSDEQKKSKNFIQKTTKKNTNGYKGVDHEEKNEVKKLEEGIMKLIENHLPPHTTKGELLYAIRRNKR